MRPRGQGLTRPCFPVDLLGLLKWRSNTNLLQQNLRQLMKVDGGEVVKVTHLGPGRGFGSFSPLGVFTGSAASRGAWDSGSDPSADSSFGISWHLGVDGTLPGPRCGVGPLRGEGRPWVPAPPPRVLPAGQTEVPASFSLAFRLRRGTDWASTEGWGFREVGGPAPATWGALGSLPGRGGHSPGAPGAREAGPAVSHPCPGTASLASHRAGSGGNVSCPLRSL